MANNVDIGGDGSLFIGEDKTFQLELLDPTNTFPVNMASMTIVFDARASDFSSSAFFTITAAIVGVFNPVRSLNTQRAQAVVTATQMNALKSAPWRYSWKITSFPETVAAWGNWYPQKATAA